MKIYIRDKLNILNEILELKEIKNNNTNDGTKESRDRERHFVLLVLCNEGNKCRLCVIRDSKHINPENYILSAQKKCNQVQQYKQE